MLRVLQEQEFERLGGTRTIRVKVRVVAATNLELLEMVQERRFRADLYYRLNVFPMSLPPLRQRSEDIPELVWHFVDRFAGRMNRQIDVIPEAVMESLRAYDWPGNVRELQNLIERAVILSEGGVLRVMLPTSREVTNGPAPATARTLVEAERDHILEVLKRSGGVISGQNGAAARLGMKRTTLHYRMRKLGIEHKRVCVAAAR